jgi:transposase-like protein
MPHLLPDRPDCPSCDHSNTRVIESRPRGDGSRQRQHECLQCGHRWSTGKRDDRKTRSPLTADEVRLCLESPLPIRQIAKQLGCSREAVSQVQRGKIHANLWPELPRRASRAGVSCHQCQHWARASCGMGLPDPIAEGPGFARDCSLFEAMKKGP